MLITDPDDHTPFLLDYIGHTSPAWGEVRIEDGTMRLWDTMTWLRLRSDVSGFIAPSAAPIDEDVTGFVPPAFERDALVVEVVTRFYEKDRNEAIGLYAARIDGHDVDGVRRAIEGTPWSLLPRPTGGHYRDVSLELRYSRGDVLIERGFMIGSHEFIDAIRPVWDRLNEVSRKLRPLATLEIHARVEQAVDDSNRYNVHVTLENRASQPVVFTDPRIPFGDERGVELDNPRFLEGEIAASIETKSRLMVEVSRSETMFMPMKATYVPLPPLPGEAPRTVILRGGGKFELEIPWAAPAPGPYWLRARWLDFDGPIEPAEGQLRFMPIPDQGPCSIGRGPYPVRGTIFTEGPFEVPGP